MAVYFYGRVHFQSQISDYFSKGAREERSMHGFLLVPLGGNDSCRPLIKFKKLQPSNPWCRPDSQAEVGQSVYQCTSKGSKFDYHRCTNEN